MAFTRFLLSGALNTGTTYLLYLAFLQLSSYQVAYSSAFVLGIFISYALNAKFVFRAGIALSSLIRFPVVYLAQYILGLGLVAILVEFAGVASWVAPIFAILVTVPFTFALSKSIFLSKKQTEADYDS